MRLGNVDYMHLGRQMEWSDARRVLKSRLADDSRMLPPRRRVFDVKPGESTRPAVFEGRPIEVKF